MQQVFDQKLYASSLTGNQRDFLNSLLNDQINVGYSNADGLLARFSGDLDKLTQYDTNLKDGMLGKDLIDVAIADYYFMQSGFTHDLFNAVAGGIGFDLKGIGADWTGNKTVVQLDKDISQILNLDFQSGAFLTGESVWSIQSGASALTATGTGSNNDAMIGGMTNDTLDGGDGNDFLYGGDGADTLLGGSGTDLLIGGTGSDTLDGGAGIDTYIVDGQDTILDSDGQGILKDKAGNIINGVIERRADGTYAFLSNTNIGVTIDANLVLTLADGSVGVIENFQSGNLGLRLVDSATQATTLNITGDLQIIDFDASTAGIQPHYDELGNRLTDGVAAPVEDILYGSAGDDHILSGGARDFADSKAGDDLIEGGTDADILAGGAGNDQIFGDSLTDIAVAIAVGSSDVPTGLKGDWLSGNGGDDTLVGGADNDVLSGGGGSDLLIAGAGDDYILGDADYTAVDAGGNPAFDWTVTLQAGGTSGDLYLFSSATGADIPVDGAADVIYAGAGNDQVFAGAGDDMAYGEAGNDTLRGESGNDILVGGAGDDRLYGGEGANYLDGGDGNDILNSGGPGSILLGGAGEDNLSAAGGGNTLDGGDDNDILVADGGRNTLSGGAGTDTLSAAGGASALDGGDGNDSLVVDGSSNTLSGGNGDDQLDGGTAGSNDLDGGDGNDILQSGGSGNRLVGGAGNDNISSAGGNNYLDGGDGIDFLGSNGDDNSLDGGSGDDTLVADQGGGNSLVGGAGNDMLSASGAGGFNSLDGGDGNDTLAAEGGDNTLSGGAGDDVLSAAGGNNFMDGGDGADYFSADGGGNTETGGAGDDSLSSTGGNSYLDGGDGSDILVVDGGGNTLYGAAGEDILHGGAGDDMLDGGADNDTLSGGDGNDVYFYNLGDGIDTILDSSAGGQINTLRFGVGISTADIMLSLGSLRLDLGNGDAIHIADFNPNDAANSSAIQNFEFADGTTLSAQQLVTTLGFDLNGTTGDDSITGTNLTDRITGGTGDDTLSGGEGDDTYLYNLGDGMDTIVDGNAAGQINTLSFGAGISPGMLVPHLDNATNNVTLDFGNGDSIAIGRQDSLAVQVLQFADGTSLGISELLAQPPSGIVGTDAAEILTGTSAADTITGGKGDDTLKGGAGSDTYIYNPGDGVDTIVDSTGSYLDPYLGIVDLGSNTLSFGAGITPNTIRVRHVGNDCMLDLGNGDGIVVGQNIVGSDTNSYGYLISKDIGSVLPINFDADPFSAFSIQMLAFQDGTTLNLQDFILQQGFARTGTDGSEFLAGESLYNTTIPGSIADRLEGGKGNDTLFGGSGDDVYVFNRGDGADAVVDAATTRWDTQWQRYLQGGNNTLLFGEGITADDITAKYQHSYAAGTYDAIVLDLGNADTIDIGPYSDNLAVKTLQFADGSTISVSDFLMQRGLVHSSVTTVWGESWNGVYNFPNIMRSLGGNDVLTGGNFDDTLEGGTGSDYMEGRSGSDTYVYNLGDGTDFIRDDFLGGNLLSFGAGIGAADITPLWNATARNLTLNLGGLDTISVGSLEDLAISTLQFSDGTSMGMQDFLLQKGLVQEAGSAGNDVMATFAGGLPLQGLGGDDQLYGSVLDDRLEGGVGDDLLAGNAGNDIMIGGQGNDTLKAGTGSDTYVYDLGDGADTVVDSGNSGSDVNTLSFGTGISRDMPLPVFDSAAWELTLELGNGDTINLGNVNDPAIQDLQFADGTSATLNDFMAQAGAIVQIDDAGNDYLEGTQFADRLEGLAGNDYLFGWESGDTMIGGTGDDYLYGGYGDDIYLFNLGDGADTIDDSSYGPGQYEGPALNEVNTLVFGDGITPDMMTHRVDRNGQVVLDVGPSTSSGQAGDSVTIGYEDDLAIQRIVFSGGAAYSIESILYNPSPVASPIADQVTQQDAQFEFILPQDSFTESSPGSSLTFSATLAGGDLLPEWLSFDAETQTFSGSPGNADVGKIDLTVTATDSAGLTAASNFKLEVLNVNDAPFVAIPLGNQNGEEASAFSLVIPADAFTDPDLIYGDSLTYSATLAGSQPLPDWLVFDPVNLTLNGTAPSGSAGLFDIDIAATDTTGATAVNPFQLNIAQAAGTNCGDGDQESSGNQDDHQGSSSDDDYHNSRETGGDHQGPTRSGTAAVNFATDNLNGTDGAGRFCGGPGNDILYGDDGDDLFIGGRGNDITCTGSGADIIAFNRGDGQDTVVAGAGCDNTVSLGGGIDYQDLTMSKSGNDLILDTGRSTISGQGHDQITMKNWFGDTANHSIANLQIVLDADTYDPSSSDSMLNHRVQSFDFALLAQEFDEALAAEPGLNAWNLTDALLSAHLAGSDAAALGGDLAYQYNLSGSLAGLSLAGARAELGNTHFGVAPKFVQPSSGMHGGGLRLG